GEKFRRGAAGFFEKKGPRRRSGARSPGSRGGGGKKIRETLKKGPPATASGAAPDGDERDRRVRADRLDLRQRRRRRSHKLELPGRPRSQVWGEQRDEGLPGPARGQRSGSADDRQASVPV